MIHEYVAPGHSVDHTEVAKYDLLDVRCVRHTYEDDVALGPDGLRMIHQLNIETLGFRRCAIPDCEPMSGRHQVGRHSPTHDSEPYETESCHDLGH